MPKLYVFEGAVRFFDDDGDEVPEIDIQEEDYTLVISPDFTTALKLQKYYRDCTYPQEEDLTDLFNHECLKIAIAKGFSEVEKAQIIAHLPVPLYDKIRTERFKDPALRSDALTSFPPSNKRDHQSKRNPHYEKER